MVRGQAAPVVAAPRRLECARLRLAPKRTKRVLASMERWRAWAAEVGLRLYLRSTRVVGMRPRHAVVDRLRVKEVCCLPVPRTSARVSQPRSHIAHCLQLVAELSARGIDHGD